MKRINLQFEKEEKEVAKEEKEVAKEVKEVEESSINANPPLKDKDEKTSEISKASSPPMNGRSHFIPWVIMGYRLDPNQQNTLTHKGKVITQNELSQLAKTGKFQSDNDSDNENSPKPGGRR